jgi:hypothetical protein
VLDGLLLLQQKIATEPMTKYAYEQKRRAREAEGIIEDNPLFQRTSVR